MNKQMTPAEIEVVRQSFTKLGPISDKAFLQPAKAQTTIGTRVLNFSTWLGAALNRAQLVSRTILSRSALGSDDVASRYSGRSWCDSTESELIHDIANCPYRRF